MSAWDKKLKIGWFFLGHFAISIIFHGNFKFQLLCLKRESILYLLNFSLNKKKPAAMSASRSSGLCNEHDWWLSSMAKKNGAMSGKWSKPRLGPQTSNPLSQPAIGRAKKSKIQVARISALIAIAECEMWLLSVNKMVETKKINTKYVHNKSINLTHIKKAMYYKLVL